ncbi:MAG TPA: AI-2E family transporter [Steroidobacteraceae bacterium]|nr:AI-2E family transporter [Steroidobacteraceae bacterium]
MKVEIERINSWLLGAALLLLLLYVGRPLLVPLGIALMLWGILNAFVDVLRRAGCPAWLAWSAALILICTSMYLMVFIFSTEAGTFAQQVPLYADKLQSIWSSHEWLQRALPSLDFSSSGSEAFWAGLLRGAIVPISGVVEETTLIVVYVGFLLAGQHHLPVKLQKLRHTSHGTEGERAVRLIGRGIQSYLGVCSFLSILMGLVAYALLASLGVAFAGFWALLMFLLTFIPVVGAVGTALPALMAFLQFGSVALAFFVLAVLILSHFILTDVVETIMLGHSLNLSPFVIMVALTFWGLLWGIAGLFLAVPLTSAFAIACRNLVGLEWLADLMQGPPRWHYRWSGKSTHPRA